MNPAPMPGLQRPLAPGEFIKYHALGNDYLVVASPSSGAPFAPAHAMTLCARHRGVGADGVLVTLPGDGVADAGLQIFNPDGSSAEKSGNGLRIFARALFDLGQVQSSEMVIRLEPTGERVRAELTGAVAPPHYVETISVGMGRARLDSSSMGMAGRQRATLHEPLRVQGHEFDAACVSLGNPHCVLFRPVLDVSELRQLGPKIERHPVFTRRTNVQFAQVIGRRQVDILIWERGVGETQASGSSASAVAVAAHCRGLVDLEVRVVSPGGELDVALDDALNVTLRGPAAPVHRGTWLDG